jgi:hypothetical protein
MSEPQSGFAVTQQSQIAVKANLRSKLNRVAVAETTTTKCCKTIKPIASDALRTSAHPTWL